MDGLEPVAASPFQRQRVRRTEQGGHLLGEVVLVVVHAPPLTLAQVLRLQRGCHLSRSPGGFREF